MRGVSFGSPHFLFDIIHIPFCCRFVAAFLAMKCKKRRTVMVRLWKFMCENYFTFSISTVKWRRMGASNVIL